MGRAKPCKAEGLKVAEALRSQLDRREGHGGRNGHSRMIMVGEDDNGGRRGQRWATRTTMGDEGDGGRFWHRTKDAQQLPFALSPFAASS